MFDVNVWVGAILVGLSLGLLGAGGSVLTVPLLVYLAKEPEKLAVAESLLIVGVVALVGSIVHLKNRAVSIYDALAFGIPSMIFASFGAYMSRFFDGQTQLVGFAITLLLASGLMLWPLDTNTDLQRHKQPDLTKLIFSGAVVGVIAGMVGVGGGFLIVPALLIFAFMPVKTAIATSLVIIVMQSIAGFSTYAIHFAKHNIEFNWPLISLVTACAVIGVFVGNTLSQKIPQQMLKRLFGLFLIPISIFILSNNI